MNYHVARGTQQLGVFAKDDAIQRYNSGTILPTDLVWTEGMASWDPASKVFGPPHIQQSGGGTPPPFTAPSPMPMPAGTPQKPANNLVWAILITIFCCWPLGIPAIVFAAQVDGKYSRGDYSGAEHSAKQAKLFIWLSVGIGLVVGVAYFFIALAGGLASAGNHY